MLTAMQVIQLREPPVADPPEGVEYALLPYQRRWFYDRARLKVSAKSRQIGITWTTACEAVDVAATRPEEGGLDVYFMTTSMDDARNFIADCAKWVTQLTPFLSGLEGGAGFVGWGHFQSSQCPPTPPAVVSC